MTFLNLKSFGLSALLCSLAFFSVKAQTVCASSYLMVSTDPASCAVSPTGSCTGNASVTATTFRGKIRAYFTTPIAIGIASPTITTAMSGATDLDDVYRFCISGDKGSAITRTFIDYCIYGEAASPAFPTGALIISFTSAGQAVSAACALTENIPCATSYLCLSGSGNCAAPCDAGFTIFTGKIRVFFPSSIPAGTSNPTITSVSDNSIVLGQYKLCASDDAATNVDRSYVDYCIYSNLAAQVFPTTALLSLGMQVGSLAGVSCNVTSVSLTCPSAFATIAAFPSCSPCDGAFPTYHSTIRLFFPTPIAAGTENPTVTSISSGGVALPDFKLCAITGSGVNSERTYADYCVYATSGAAVLPAGALGFNLKLSDCSSSLLCVVEPTPVMSCINMNNVMYTNITTGPNGAGGAAAGCTDMTTCSGLPMFFAGNMTLSFSPCLAAGVAAPAITSFTREAVDGTIVRYCVSESSGSAALIGSTRCSITYCVISTVSNDQYLAGNPVLDLNAGFSVTVGGLPQVLTQDDCSAANIVLPVKFGGFTASRTGDKVILKWDTYSESNNKGFFIQRNISGNWVNAGFERTAAMGGNSSERLYYSYTDINNFVGTTQYRLQQMDLDGRTAYSDTRPVKGNALKFSVFPNPSTDGKVTLVISGDNASSISIRNSMGQEVRQIRNVAPGALQLSNFAAGYYTIQVTDPKTGVVTNARFVVSTY
jgi:hypothetical protein